MSEDDRTLIDKLYYRKGLSVARILQIEHFRNYTTYKIYNYLNAKNCKIKSYKSERAKKVIELKKKGIPYKEIAKMTNLCLKTVYNYANLDL